MPHYESYDSFKTKKSIDKKNRAKERSAKKKIDDTFMVSEDLIGDNNSGIIIETSYKEARVLFNDKIINVFGMQKNIPCNQLVFPGDVVLLDKTHKRIEHVIHRSTVLSRDHSDSTRRGGVATNKILATNIDTAVIVVSAFSPPLHPKFIDRYLIILQDCGIEPIICLNKCDLKTANDEDILDIYRNLEITVIETSAINNYGIDTLKTHLKGKRAIFVGHSGVGKSSLVNRIMDFDDIKIESVGEKSKKGRHTTTSSKYYVWDCGSSIIDTPGIRSLDVSDFKVSEIQDYFSEFKNYLTCKYRSCDHVNIPVENCGVKQAVSDGKISKSRYESYARIIEDLTDSSKNQKI